MAVSEWGYQISILRKFVFPLVVSQSYLLCLLFRLTANFGIAAYLGLKVNTSLPTMIRANIKNLMTEQGVYLSNFTHSD